MKLLDRTLDTPAENLALDEALLEQAEQGDGTQEYLRLWESHHPFVVLGRASRARDEIDLDRCHQLGLPVLRRCSGGASVVVGPGCLMYAVVLSYRLRPHLQRINLAHELVLDHLARALLPLVPEVRYQGTSDLTLGDRKFSGNSLRCKRGHLLYHGTLLYDFPLELIAACLRTPPRQPEYRQTRSHARFLVNLPIDGPPLRAALVAAWNANQPLIDWPQAPTQRLRTTRYDRPEWNLRH